MFDGMKKLKKQLENKVQCLKGEHAFAIVKWRWTFSPFDTDKPSCIVAHARCTRCGKEATRLIRDPKQVRRIKARCGSLCEKRW